MAGKTDKYPRRKQRRQYVQEVHVVQAIPYRHDGHGHGEGHWQLVNGVVVSCFRCVANKQSPTNQARRGAVYGLHSHANTPRARCRPKHRHAQSIAQSLSACACVTQRQGRRWADLLQKGKSVNSLTDSPKEASMYNC
jgi:hypothetical protein